MYDDTIVTSSQIGLLLRLNKQIKEMQDKYEDVRKEIIEVREVQEDTTYSHLVFKTYEDLEIWLTPENISKLKLGASIYIVERDVADLWFDGSELHAIEGEKLDLSPFAMKSDVDIIESDLAALSSEFETLVTELPMKIHEEIASE